MPAIRDMLSPARLFGLVGLGLMSGVPSFAQPATPDNAAARPPGITAAGRRAGGLDRARFRRLAPGVMKVVDPQRAKDEEFARHDLVELLASDPSYAERAWSEGKSPAKDTVFRRKVWNLEFAFKPVRFVEVDVPRGDGRMERKLVWYLVYSIKNTSDEPIVFVPRFVLASKDTGKLYPDRLIPLAVSQIRRREDPKRPLLNSVEITGRIPVSPAGRDGSVWGVATWEDVDPSTDFFSIYVQGLTNAYQWEDPPGAYKSGNPPGTGRELFPKTLILNFWRPGDKEYEHEEEIRFVDYAWDYGQLTPAGFVAKKVSSAQAPAAAVPAEENLGER